MVKLHQSTCPNVTYDSLETVSHFGLSFVVSLVCYTAVFSVVT